MLLANDYQQRAMRTLCERADNYSDLEIMLVWNALKLCGEAGEIAEHIGKGVFHRHGIDRDHLIKELGDVLWYVAALCTKLGVPMSEVMERNIEKLDRRYPDGWDTERSINRDVLAECPQASPDAPGATEVPDQTVCTTTQPEQL